MPERERRWDREKREYSEESSITEMNNIEDIVTIYVLYIPDTARGGLKCLYFYTGYYLLSNSY